jgi:hypothetical protein
MEMVEGRNVDMARLVERLPAHIPDGPTEVHKWSLARKIKRDAQTGRDR